MLRSVGKGGLLSHVEGQLGCLSILGQTRSFAITSIPGARTHRMFSDRSKLATWRKHAAAKDRKPTLDIAMTMPLSPQELDNASLVTLGALGEHSACKEILKRHIMSVDKVSYDEACGTFELILKKNREGMFLLALPYQIGISVAVLAGFGSLPMVFDLGVAEWFNEYFVTTDVPEPEDLETFLEVGNWTWNWMEPPLGTISFTLLCLQYSRAQLENLGIKPYTSQLKRMRGERLARAFPQYDARVLIDYSKTALIYEK